MGLSDKSVSDSMIYSRNLIWVVVKIKVPFWVP